MKAYSVKSSWLRLNPALRVDAAYWIRVAEQLESRGITTDAATDAQVKAAIAEVEEALSKDEAKVKTLREQANSLVAEARRIELRPKPTKGRR